MRLRDMRPGFVLDHLWTRRHLHEYLDGELDDRGRERIERHAHPCPACHRLVTTLRRTLDGLAALRQRQPVIAAPISDTVIALLRREPG